MMTWLAAQGTLQRIVDPGAGSGRFGLSQIFVGSRPRRKDQSGRRNGGNR
jgi:predicted RNA methylase